MPWWPDPALLSRDPGRRAEAHLRRAARRYPKLRYGGAGARAVLRHLERAAALSPEFRYRLALAIARYEEFEAGMLHSQSEALERFRRQPEPDPNTEAGQAVLREMARIELCPPAPATGAAGEPEFEVVLRADPGNAAAHFFLGVVRLRRGDPAAEAHFRAAAAADAENSLPLALAALMRLRARDPAGAVLLVREGNGRPACRTYPSPAAALDDAPLAPKDAHLGYYLLRAVAEVARGLVESPKERNPAAGSSYAYALLAAGRLQEALAAAEAVWGLAGQFAGLEPLDSTNAFMSGALRHQALQAMDAVCRDAGDAAGVAQVEVRREAQAEATRFLHEWAKRAIRPEWSRLYGRMLPGLAGMAIALALVIGTLAVALLPSHRNLPRAAGLGFGAALCAVWGVRSMNRHSLAWAREREAESEAAIRGYLERMPR